MTLKTEDLRLGIRDFREVKSENNYEHEKFNHGIHEHTDKSRREVLGKIFTLLMEFQNVVPCGSFLNYLIIIFYLRHRAHMCTRVRTNGGEGQRERES